MPAMEGLAIRTRSTVWFNSCWWSRNASRNSRRVRDRVTAGPTFRLTITPRRLGPGGRAETQFMIRQPCTSRRPSAFARAKSRRALMRREAGRRHETGVSAATRNRERSGGGEPLASDPASVAQDRAPAFGTIPGQEAVLPFPANFGRLILSLHVSSSLFEKIRRRYMKALLAQ